MRSSQAIPVSPEGKMDARVVSAEFFRSVYHASDLPEPDVPEFAFAGRSNVGKSTLLNAICGRKGLAKTSQTPGRTQALNFFDIEILFESEGAAPRREKVRFVDLPGYGYAKVSKKEREKWASLIESYLYTRKNLRGVFLLLDCRRTPEPEEEWFVHQDFNWKLQLILTKSDKLSKNALSKQLSAVAKQFEVSPSTIFPTAFVGKKKTTVSELAASLVEMLG